MIEQGKFVRLNIVKRSTFGLFLGDEAGEEVLLPNKYCTDSMKPGLEVDVFIYRDSEDRKVATTLTPKILFHEFALFESDSDCQSGCIYGLGAGKGFDGSFQRTTSEYGRGPLVYCVPGPG